jgi:hypothetical protein
MYSSWQAEMEPRITKNLRSIFISMNCDSKYTFHDSFHFVRICLHTDTTKFSPTILSSTYSWNVLFKHLLLDTKWFNIFLNWKLLLLFLQWLIGWDIKQVNACHSLRGCLHHGPWSWLTSTSVYITKKLNARVIMKLKIPKRHVFWAYIIQCHGSTSFVMGETKEVLSMQISRDHGRATML